MPTTKSETSRVSSRRTASMPAYARGPAAGNLAHPNQHNWHLMAGRAHGKLGTCPSAPFAGRVLP